MDHLVLAQIQHDQVLVNGRACAQLLLGGTRVIAIELDTLGDVRQLEHLLHAQLEARVDQLHHQLVVGDAKVAEAAETGPRVHQEAEQDPPRRRSDLIE